jgi:hypothetical protein
MRHLALIICILLMFQAVFSQQRRKITITTVHFDLQGMNDTIMEFYNERNEILRVENKNIITHNFYKDTSIYKTVSVSKTARMKDCFDTVVFIYTYTNDLLTNTVWQSNSCPATPRGTDGYVQFEDTMPQGLKTTDSIVYSYDKHHNLIEERSFEPGGLEPRGRILKKYDSANRMAEEKTYVGKFLRTVSMHSFQDTMKYIDRWYYFEQTGMLPVYTKVFETYNKNGQLVKKLQVQQSNGFEKLTTYSYRLDGKLDDEITWSGVGVLITVVKYQYGYW